MCVGNHASAKCSQVSVAVVQGLEAELALHRTNLDSMQQRQETLQEMAATASVPPATGSQAPASPDPHGDAAVAVLGIQGILDRLENLEDRVERQVQLMQGRSARPISTPASPPGPQLADRQAVGTTPATSHHPDTTHALRGHAAATACRLAQQVATAATVTCGGKGCLRSHCTQADAGRRVDSASWSGAGGVKEQAEATHAIIRRVQDQSEPSLQPSMQRSHAAPRLHLNRTPLWCCPPPPSPPNSICHPEERVAG